MIIESEHSSGDWEVLAEEILFKLLKAGEPFSANDFNDIARNYFMPPKLMRKFTSSMFGDFERAGYIKKSEASGDWVAAD